jgi:hypothetical protein
MFRRSDFRNAHSVRKVSRWQPAKAMKEKLSWQILIAATNQTPVKYTPSKRSRKPKWEHLPEKSYVHATMKNEALLGAKMEW